MTALRDGHTQALTATLGQLDAPKTEARGGPAERGSEGRFGMALQSTDDGVVVAQLDPNGVAAESGLREGDVIGKIDGMLIEAVDGSVHWERTRPFLEAGIPCFVDKPFACSLADARKMTNHGYPELLQVVLGTDARKH